MDRETGELTIRAADFAASEGRSIERIYEEALPTYERKPTAWLRQAAGRADYQILAAAEAGRTIGFSVLCALSSARVCLLEYIAVERTHRDAGVGGELFEATLATPFVEGRPVLIEVDDPETAPDRRIAERRKGFYARHGCRELEGLTYLLPLGGEPTPMQLMVRGPALPDRLPAAEAAAWLAALYADVYGCGPDDPRLTRMIAALPAEVRLV